MACVSVCFLFFPLAGEAEDRPLTGTASGEKTRPVLAAFISDAFCMHLFFCALTPLRRAVQVVPGQRRLHELRGIRTQA